MVFLVKIKEYISYTLLLYYTLLKSIAESVLKGNGACPRNEKPLIANKITNSNTIVNSLSYSRQETLLTQYQSVGA